VSDLARAWEWLYRLFAPAEVYARGADGWMRVLVASLFVIGVVVLIWVVLEVWNDEDPEPW
jgi:hypothetical protein